MDTIINSDFFVDVMVRYMTIHQLLEFRQITVQLYKYMSIDKIKGLIIERIQNYIKGVMGSKYDEFIGFIEKMGGRIIDPGITRLIYGQPIIVDIFFRETNYWADVDREIRFEYWCMFKEKIRFAEYDLSTRSSEIFQNYIKIVDGQWHLEIKNLNKLVNKRDQLDLCLQITFHKCIDECKKCDIQLDIKRVSHYILSFDYSILGFYDGSDIMILGSCVKSAGRYVNIKVVNHHIYPYVDMKIKRKCTRRSCILNMWPYEHFHSRLGYRTYRFNALLVKYTLDDDIFGGIKKDINRHCDYIDADKCGLEKLPSHYFYFYNK